MTLPALAAVQDYDGKWQAKVSCSKHLLAANLQGFAATLTVTVVDGKFTETVVQKAATSSDTTAWSGRLRAGNASIDAVGKRTDGAEWYYDLQGKPLGPGSVTAKGPMTNREGVKLRDCDIELVSTEPAARSLLAQSPKPLPAASQAAPALLAQAISPPPAPVTASASAAPSAPAAPAATPQAAAPATGSSLPPCRSSNIRHNCTAEVGLPNGERYVGEFRNNRPEGKGRYTYANGEYVGSFKNGTMEGEGVETLPNGSRYEGQYQNGKFDGRGVATFKDGSKYEGEFRGGVRQGFGTYTLANGKTESGRWENNRLVAAGAMPAVPIPKGPGVHTLDNGIPPVVGRPQSPDYTVGTLVSRLPDCQGPEESWTQCFGTTVKNEKTYEGEFVNGKLEGIGKVTQKNQAVLIGQWKNGLMEGRGEIVFPKRPSDPQREHYIGNFKSDKPSGAGVYTYRTGTVYTGNFVEGKEEGQGTKRHEDGSVYTGSFKNDNRDGKGVLKYYDASVYEGDFKDDQPHGQGVFSLSANTCRVPGSYCYNKGPAQFAGRFVSMDIPEPNLSGPVFIIKAVNRDLNLIEATYTQGRILATDKFRITNQNGVRQSGVYSAGQFKIDGPTIQWSAFYQRCSDGCMKMLDLETRKQCLVACYVNDK